MFSTRVLTEAFLKCPRSSDIWGSKNLQKCGNNSLVPGQLARTWHSVKRVMILFQSCWEGEIYQLPVG